MQHARASSSTILHENYKSPFPALNVSKRDEFLTAETMHRDTPGIDDCSTSA